MTEPAPALKEIFNAERLRHIAEQTAAVHAGFDRRRFLRLAGQDLDALSLMQRLRRVSQALHACLPDDYPRALEILQALAPRLNHRFVTLVLPDYVACHGLHDFDLSMQALRFFTPFGTSEYGVRPFLRQDLPRALAHLHAWTQDDDEHVRRLASEGARPRLPWSFHLDALRRDPAPAAQILERLKTDESLYVRKSVANHLNDIAKDNPEWLLQRLQGWSTQDPRTAWIVRHGLRTLIKRGERRALALVGAGEPAQVRLQALAVQPGRLKLGGRIALSLTLVSTCSRPQRLVIDYAIHYVKRDGTAAPKVFKLKTLELPAGATLTLTRTQRMQDFSTRRHHPGRHAIDLLVNGERLGGCEFTLLAG
ncbi:DNA alkylation repair protein [Orrella sp. JC864]|uniref:DNA alkylation repair protein n=1 Tax=Orrella sp. JC864 TaxID=3120298 RepID=UPI0030085337